MAKKQATKTKGKVAKAQKTYKNAISAPKMRIYYAPGCPNSMPVKLTYTTDQSFNVVNQGNALIPSIAYRANGPFDPEVAIGGGQPRYYDQWAALYNKVTVTHARFKIQYATQTAGSLPTWICVATATDSDTSRFTTVKSFMEAPYNNVKLSGTTGQNTSILDWYPNQYFIGKTIYDEDMASTTALLPIREVFFHVQLKTQTNNADSATRGAILSVEYDCLFFDKIIPTES